MATLFSLLVFFTLFLTIVFRVPNKQNFEVAQNLKLYPLHDLDTITEIDLKNKNGNFILEKKNYQSNFSWALKIPKEMPANPSFPEKLFQSLERVSIKKIYPDNNINNINFALEKPNATLVLIDHANKKTTIEIGLMNSIDHSLYLKFSNRSGIFHIEELDVPLETTTFLDLIDSTIINLHEKSLTRLSVFKNKKIGQPFFELKRNNIEELKRFSTIKSSFLLEKETEAQKRIILNYNKKPDYVLTIEDERTVIEEYNISNIFYTFPDLDLKGEGHFLITQKNSSTAFLVKKEFFSLFERH